MDNNNKAGSPAPAAEAVTEAPTAPMPTGAGAAGDPFEDNLRQILSNDAVPNVSVKTQRSGAASAQSAGAFVPDQAAIDKMKAEQRALLIFKILRPIAAVAFVVLLAMFVARITMER